MPLPRVTHAAVSYQSSACLIGTHEGCTHSAPVASPADIPVVYESCACPCHPADAPRPTHAEKR
ncbi:hypothetical protein GCM10010232_47630 [Streptomyces amakusaensis]|uniref:Uncharacterized protein n=1 Tax=Streptomyces amakusaensis TaxID=67271 RepID=A0ABW0AK12_9ACTN